MAEETKLPVEGELIDRNEADALADQLGLKDRPGRPSAMTAEVVRKLIAAFHNGFNIVEACQYSGIGRQTYYDWLAKDDFFSYKMSEAQSMVNRKAKQVVVEAIAAGDVTTAKWYLNARDPEFKAKGEIGTPEGQQATEAKLKEFMDDTNDGAYPSLSAQAGDPAGSEADAGSEQSVTTASTGGGDEVAPSPSDIS